MAQKSSKNPARIVGKLRDKLADLDRDLTGLEGVLKGDINTPFNGNVKAAHRAAHKPGVPAKVEADPEVKAFILTRIDALTFGEIITELKRAFPPERHVSRSSLHRWWHKTGRFLPPNTAPTAEPQSAIISNP